MKVNKLNENVYQAESGYTKLSLRVGNCSSRIFLIYVEHDNGRQYHSYSTAYLLDEDIFTNDWTYLDRDDIKYMIEDVDVDGCHIVIYEDYSINKYNNDELYEFVNEIKDDVLAEILLSY